LPEEVELMHLLTGCIGYLAGVEKITGRVLNATQDLRVISRNGTGVDNIDLEAAGKKQIQICRTAGANAQGVAELTLALLLALVRSIPFSDAGLKKTRWQRSKGIELKGRVLGLVGCGEIGKRTARMAVGMGMQVVAYDFLPDPSLRLNNFAYVDLADLYRRADFISLHCPAAANGEPIIGAGEIRKMKKGVFLINTARASLLDHDAVLAGLESGNIAGLALDVFDVEPPDDYRLVQDERVIATPHIGGYTYESVTRATVQAVENLIQALK
jgi:phosphoglycerate dehydrogenase-like enzyme